MKIIAFYLPQFHSIPENDKWWGKGFTEWVNVRKAKPLFKGHNQPRIPMNNNYYSLLDNQTLEWQVNLANKYDVYGFCFYHYWFSGKKLLEKPVEMFLQNKKLKTKFCLCWANESWTNVWANGNANIIMEQKYGTKKDWKQHFDYLLMHFQDQRYIVEENKPLLIIYRPELIESLQEMLEYWNELAKENGFSGINYAYQNVSYSLSGKCDNSLFKYAIEYQPNWALGMRNLSKIKILKKKLLLFFEKRLKINLREKLQKNKKLEILEYDDIWKEILDSKPRYDISVPGAFVDWDNTPRKGNRGLVINNSTPEKFEKYLCELIKKAKYEYQKDMIFVFAWNEWAEGGYLEPDEKNRYGYLEAIKNAIDKVEGDKQ